MQKPISFFILLCFFVTSIIGPLPLVQAQDFALPAPGVMVNLSSKFNPPILKGIKVHPDNPFRFDFILDKGNSKLNNDELKEESTRLIKYFLASLTVPEQDLWVNLSPYEKNRIIPPSFGLTEMGRDLLAQDYMLKQITASLIYPDGHIGQEFWKRIYQEAAKRYGTTSVPVNTFNKVWIVPEKAVVYENAKIATAYVVKSRLKVMLEQDYLSLEKHGGILSKGPQTKTTNQWGSQIVREVVIPELTKEVNEGQNFAQLRQAYNSLILAAWYKKKIRDSILSQVYADKKKVDGVGYQGSDIDAIYRRYLQAFKKGVFNYIKEEIDPLNQETIPRKYFSGGVQLRFGNGVDSAMSITTVLPSGLSQPADMSMITVDFKGVHGTMKNISVRKPSTEEPEVDLSKYEHRFEERVPSIGSDGNFSFFNKEIPFKIIHINASYFPDPAYYFYSSLYGWIIVMNDKVEGNIQEEVLDHEKLEIAIRVTAQEEKIDITEQQAHILASAFQRFRNAPGGVQLTRFDKWQISEMNVIQIYELLNEDRSWHTQQFASLIPLFSGLHKEIAIRYRIYKTNFYEALKARLKELYYLKSFQSPSKKGINRIIVSPDGKSVVTGGKDGRVFILDIDNFNVIKELNVQGSFLKEITALKFSADGKTLAAGDTVGQVAVWNLNSKNLLAPLIHLEKEVPIQSLRFTDSKKVTILEIIIQGGSARYRVDKITEVARAWSPGEPITYYGKGKSVFVQAFPSGVVVGPTSMSGERPHWQAHQGEIQTIVFAEDDQRFLSTGKEDKKIKFWQIKNGQLMQEMTSKYGNVQTMAFLKGDRYVATGDDQGWVVIWDLATGKSFFEVPFYMHIRSLVVSPEGKIIMVGDIDQIRVIDITLPGNSHDIPKIENELPEKLKSDLDIFAKQENWYLYHGVLLNAIDEKVITNMKQLQEPLDKLAQAGQWTIYNITLSHAINEGVVKSMSELEGPLDKLVQIGEWAYYNSRLSDAINHGEQWFCYSDVLVHAMENGTVVVTLEELQKSLNKLATAKEWHEYSWVLQKAIRTSVINSKEDLQTLLNPLQEAGEEGYYNKLLVELTIKMDTKNSSIEGTDPVILENSTMEFSGPQIISSPENPDTNFTLNAQLKSLGGPVAKELIGTGPHELLEIHPVTGNTIKSFYLVRPLTAAPASNPSLIQLWQNFRTFEQLNADVLGLLNRPSKTVDETFRMLKAMENMVQLYEYLFKGQSLDRPLTSIAADGNDLQGGRTIAQIFLRLKDHIEASLKLMPAAAVIPGSLDRELNRYDKENPGNTGKLIVSPAENYSQDTLHNISFAEFINIVHQKGNRNFSSMTGSISAQPQSVVVDVTSGQSQKQVALSYLDARAVPNQNLPQPVVLIALALAKGAFIHNHYQVFSPTINIIADEHLATMNMKLGVHSATIQFNLLPVPEGGRVVVKYTDSGTKYEPGSGIRVKALAEGFKALGFEVRQEGYFMEAIFDKDTGAKSMDELPKKLAVILQALISTKDLDLRIRDSHALNSNPQKTIDNLAEQLKLNGYIWRGNDAAMKSKDEQDWKKMAQFLQMAVPHGPIGQLFIDDVIKRYQILVNRDALIQDKKAGTLSWNKAYQEAQEKSPVVETLHFLEMATFHLSSLEFIRQMALVAQTMEPFVSQRQVLASIGDYTLEKMVLPTTDDIITFYVFRDGEGTIRGAWAVQGEFYFHADGKGKINVITLKGLDILIDQNLEMSQKMREKLRQLTGKEYDNIRDFLMTPDSIKYLPAFSLEDLIKPVKLQSQISPLSLGGQMMNAGFSLSTAKFRTGTPQVPEDFKGSILIAPMTDARDDSHMKESSGIVVTTGGLLSHAAIRAREFNKPSVILNGAQIEDGKLRFTALSGEQKRQEYQFQGKPITVYERSSYQQVTVEVEEGDLVAVDANQGIFYVVAKAADKQALEIYSQYCLWKKEHGKESADIGRLQDILRGISNESLLRAVLMDIVNGQLLSPQDFEALMTDYLSKHPDQKEMLLSFILRSASDEIGLLQENKRLFDQMIKEKNISDVLILTTKLMNQMRNVRQMMAVANGQWALSVTTEELALMEKEILSQGGQCLMQSRQAILQSVKKAELAKEHELSYLARLEALLNRVGLGLKTASPILFEKMNQLIKEREDRLQLLSHRSTLSKDEIKDRWARPLVGGKSSHSAEIQTALDLLRNVLAQTGLQIRVPDGFAVTISEYERWESLNKPKDLNDEAFNQLRQELFDRYKNIILGQINRINALMQKDERTSEEVEKRVKKIMNLLLGAVEEAHNAKSLEVGLLMGRELVRHLLSDDQLEISNSLRNRLEVIGIVAARSSGKNEDGLEESGAGTRLTVLGIDSYTKLLQAVPRVWASGSECVLIEEMINAKKSVLAFSADAIDQRPDHLRIEAADGLAKGLVDHSVHDPDIFVLNQDDIIQEPRHIGTKTEQVVLDFNHPDSVITKDRPAQSSSVLNDLEIKGISTIVRKMASYFGFFADMEASFDADNELVPLQIRPVTTLTDTMKEGLQILEKAHKKDEAMTINRNGGTQKVLSKGKGGIDFTSDITNLEIQNQGQAITFHLDPAMLQQLQHASGFVPVIINIQPMTDLRQFLGLKDQKNIPDSI